MKLLIIEDEHEAAQRLIRMLKEIDSTIEIAGQTESISATNEWFGSNNFPDAILSDIELADGYSFEIFRKREMQIPVIFITAFNQYAIEAFKHYSADYLLKPVKKAELEMSLQKLKQFYLSKPKTPEIDYQKLAQLITKQETASTPKRIVTKIGQNIKAFELDEIAYFFTENKITYLATKEHSRVPVDYTMDELEKLSQPAGFFRINRQFIVHIRAVKKMVSLTKGRVKL
ncbi:MAG: response regulator transcription factor, partial [Pedobacter sp.]